MISIYAGVVVLNTDTTKLFNAYEESLKQAGIQIASSDTGARSAAAAGDIRVRQGLLHPLRAAVEKSLDIKLGANQRQLDAFDVFLDPAAEVLLESYQNFLNNALIEQGIHSEKLQSHEIASPYVLVRHLLMRLVAQALDTISDKGEKSLPHIHALEFFWERIKKDELLIVDRFDCVGIF